MYILGYKVKINVNVYLHLSISDLFPNYKKIINWNSKKVLVGGFLVACGGLWSFACGLWSFAGGLCLFVIVACFSNYK